MKNRLHNYLLGHFAASFFPLFGALFLIASVVAFVQLSTMTSVIKMSFWEMFLLYLTHVPTILLYTLPITFFSAMTITFARLSFDLELTVIFSLKASVGQLLRPFGYISVVLAMLLLALGLVVKPKAYFIQKAFIYAKQDDAQINIRPSEFGQRFGDWMLFVGKETGENRYEEVVLFSKGDRGDQGHFVLADRGRVDNEGGLLSLLISEGRAYQTGTESIGQIDFSRMRVNEPSHLRALDYEGIRAYWAGLGESDKVARELSWTLAAALFVLICLPAAAAFGIHNPRFEKNRASAWALLMTLLFYVPAFFLGEKMGLLSLAIVTPAWLLVVAFFYYRRIWRTF
jgi:lipopolysaccharide export system permease protein